MKICFISDTHRKYNNLIIPECDLLIHCGDDDLNGELPVLALNDWFGKQPAKKIIFVPGNHDFMAQDEPEEFKRLLSNASILIDEEINVNCLKIYGTPWTPTFYDWAFMKSDIKLAKEFAKIPNDLNILISHGPPIYILDQNFRGQHCGSQSLYNAVKEKNPKIHVFGHIHEGRGELITEKTHFINAACCPIWDSNGYKEFAPIILEIS